MLISRTIIQGMGKNLQNLYNFCSHRYSSSMQSVVLT